MWPKLWLEDQLQYLWLKLFELLIFVLHLVNTLLLFRCHQCVQALYCSDSCRNQSWNEYHQYECGSFDLLHSIGIAHLGLRVVLVAGLERLTALQKAGLLVSEDNIACTPNEKYGNKDNNYIAVYNLLTHINNMKTGDTFQYALVSVPYLQIEVWRLSRSSDT